MLGGLILVPIVSLFTQKSVPADVDEMFKGYTEKITVTADKSLEEI